MTRNVIAFRFWMPIAPSPRADDESQAWKQEPDDKREQFQKAQDSRDNEDCRVGAIGLCNAPRAPQNIWAHGNPIKLRRNKLRNDQQHNVSAEADKDCASC
ncbi:hypothetical protein CQ010_07650 [Arthrobacter sp. MYb211]|nr:hypothetical protein CQ015_08345 [Arthrobacter sp. MYb221]PRC08301.1 hypothetical protein CQ010_07650 [Arthrobacter sp. MYb211]